MKIFNKKIGKRSIVTKKLVQTNKNKFTLVLYICANKEIEFLSELKIILENLLQYQKDKILPLHLKSSHSAKEK